LFARASLILFPRISDEETLGEPPPPTTVHVSPLILGHTFLLLDFISKNVPYVDKKKVIYIKLALDRLTYILKLLNWPCKNLYVNRKI